MCCYVSIFEHPTLHICHLNLWFFIDAQHLAKREIFLFNFHDQGHRFHTWLTFNAFSYIRHRPRKRQWVGTFLFNSIFKTITHGTHQTKWIWTRKHLIDFLLLFVFKSIRFFFSYFFHSGMAGFFAVAGYGLYNFRKRNVSASVYLMQLRVAAQGTVVGTLCLGLMYSMYNQYYLKKQQPVVSDTNQSHQH